MTYRNEEQIQRLPNGAIDYSFYDLHARRIRSKDFTGAVSHLFGKLRRPR